MTNSHALWQSGFKYKYKQALPVIPTWSRPPPHPLHSQSCRPHFFSHPPNLSPPYASQVPLVM